MTHQRKDATSGSFLVAPLENKVALVSTSGRTMKTWTFDQRVYNTYLLRDGTIGAITLSVQGDRGFRPFGRFQIRDDESRLLWEYINPDIHHDFEELENGEFLFITYATRSVEKKGHVGKCDRIIRVNRKKEITWELDLTPFIPWNEITDELDEGVKTKDGNFALCHANSVRFKDNKVLVSARNLSRVMVFDYTEKKLLWMSPKGAFHRQHDAQWLPDGRILVFNNQEAYTLIQVDKIKPSSVMTIDPLTNQTQVLAVGKGFPFHWSSPFMGGAQLLSNGNVWVSVSLNGQMIEVDRDNHIVQRFVVHPIEIENSNTTFFRSRFYEDKPVKPESVPLKTGMCPTDYVSWDSCRTQLTEGKQDDTRDAQLSLPPKACDGWEGKAIFRCDKGKWEMIKADRCEWSCPCCY